MAYLLDANIFIEAKNRHYGMDFCPAFWEWLVQQNKACNVFSIEKVADELAAGDDDLSKWAVQRGTDFFLPPDDNVLGALQQVSQWVIAQQYAPAAFSTFFQVADYYLVAHALGHNHIVVTHEVPINGTRKVKIPNVCIGLKIKFMNPYEMLRLERARFILKSSVGTA
jgi:hypothetical protein